MKIELTIWFERARKISVAVIGRRRGEGLRGREMFTLTKNFVLLSEFNFRVGDLPEGVVVNLFTNT